MKGKKCCDNKGKEPDMEGMARVVSIRRYMHAAGAVAAGEDGGAKRVTNGAVQASNSCFANHAAKSHVMQARR
jgi:hypothetical protein